jgi:hypothetical protein
MTPERKQYLKEYYSKEENKIKRREYTKKYKEKNKNSEKYKEMISLSNKKQREKNRDALVEYSRKYNQEKKDILREKRKNKIKNNPELRIYENLRNRARIAIKRAWSDKAYKSIELLGCTPQEARQHLESLFKPGMTWDNYGKGDGYWEIDHIIPISSFDLTDPEQQKKCFHYTNLQPLWWYDNLVKSNKMPLDKSQDTI